MKKNYTYRQTKKIENLLEKLENLNKDFNKAIKDLPPKKFKELQKESLLRSAIASARIEGNPLTREDFLLPRRKEILEIIKDHKTVSFDFISRRFLAIPESTLHYDLRQLAKIKLIKKLGSTKGAVYEKK